MKIALLSYIGQMHWFMSGLESGFKEHGNDVKCFYQVGPKKHGDHELINWLNFDLEKLEQFNPERLYIFNGHAQQSCAVTHYLKMKYDVYFVERGWLPQSKNIYIDRVGLGARSSIRFRNLSKSKDPANTILTDKLRKGVYNTSTLKPSGLKDYILIPLQLENDTSIVYDSPYFKTMQSLVDFVAKNFPDEHIVVKRHPKDQELVISGNYKNMTILKNEYPMHQLAFESKAVIGINSTSLIESLVHYKPVAMLGHNVVSGSKNICMHSEESFKNLRSILDFRPCKASIDATLKLLIDRQFPLESPPLRVVKNLLV